MDEIKQIIKYGVKWDIDEQEGMLWLRDAGGDVYEEKVAKSKDLHLLVHLLQTEKPIYYHPKDHYLSTSMEIIGEESKAETKGTHAGA